MRHRVKGRKLGRTTPHRKALERNIVTSLFIYGRVITTVEKAKEFRGTADRLITWGKKGGLQRFRQILRFVQDPKVVKKIMGDVKDRFTERPGGYTRVVKLGGCRWDGDGRGLYATNRLGDNGKKAIWELVVRKDVEEEVRLAGRGPLARREDEDRKAGKRAGKKAKAGAK